MSESVVSHFFPHLFLFSALLSARRCSPAGDVIVKCTERKQIWLVFAWMKGYFFHLSPPLWF